MSSKEKGSGRFFYGWVIVFALFLVNMIPMVLVSNYASFFQVPICEELGVTYAAFSIESVFGSLAGVVFSMFLAGRLGKGNIRAWMLACGLVTAAGVFGQSLITALWQFYILRFIVNFAISGITFIPINTLLARWFDDKKGMATAIVYSGAGIGGMVFSPVLSQMIAQVGWRESYVCIAVATAVIAVVLGLLIVGDPAQKGQTILRRGGERASAEPDGPVTGLAKSECLRQPSYWLLIIAVFCGGLLASGVTTQLPTFIIEQGMDYALVMVFFSGAMVVTKLALGPLFDKLGIAVGTTIQSVGLMLSMVCLLLTPKLGIAAACAGAALVSFNCVADLVAPLMSGKLFGYSNFADNYGLINVGFMLGAMFGPTFSASVRTFTGSYEVAWIVMLGVAVVLEACAMLALSSGRKLPALWHE